MKPEEILEGCGVRYEQCRTYSDSGFVDFEAKSGKERIDFRTLFRRPDYYSFEWQDYGPRRGKSEEFSTLWSQDGETVTLYRWGLESKENLRLAVAGATGCSAGVASIVPNLLMRKMRENSRHLLELTDLQLLRMEDLDGDDCYVLGGSLWTGIDHIVWISTSNSSIRRVHSDRSSAMEEIRTEQQTLRSDEERGESGIAPRQNMPFENRQFVLEFNFNNVQFDEPIVPLSRPDGPASRRFDV
jgi:hypothetical protein